jgi:carboxymethylenebutenolidase
MSRVWIIIVVIALTAGSGVFFWQKQATSSTSTPTTTNAAALTSDKTIEIKTETVEYFQGIKGYYAAPADPGTYPGIVMIHEWWGLNDHIKSMADILAKEGYQVLAVDLHKGTVAKTPEEARALTSILNQEEAIENLKAATAYLRDHDAPKIASLGWCFGGGQSLQLATSGESLNATVIYYGTLTADKTKLANITWPVLGIFGDKDVSIPPAKVEEFQTALNALNIKNSITMYPNVGHAFANPTGQNYAAEETRDAWTKTLLFLKENLKPEER